MAGNQSASGKELSEAQPQMLQVLYIQVRGALWWEFLLGLPASVCVWLPWQRVIDLHQSTRSVEM